MNSLLEASTFSHIRVIREGYLPTDPLVLAIWPSIASLLIHRFFTGKKGCLRSILLPTLNMVRFLF
jgi:hypothetical protein